MRYLRDRLPDGVLACRYLRDGESMKVLGCVGGPLDKVQVALGESSSWAMVDDRAQRSDLSFSTFCSYLYKEIRLGGELVLVPNALADELEENRHGAL